MNQAEQEAWRMEQIFGDRLRMIRKRRGMTQSDLAQALGVTVQTVVRYESLRLEELRPARLTAIAEALEVSEAELTGQEEDEAAAGEADIQLLTRGLRNMSPDQRDKLIALMMPIVLQYQNTGGAEKDSSASSSREEPS